TERNRWRRFTTAVWHDSGAKARRENALLLRTSTKQPSLFFELWIATSLSLLAMTRVLKNASRERDCFGETDVELHVARQCVAHAQASRTLFWTQAAIKLSS